MTVKEMYEKFDDRIPKSLSEPWDNDGLMCSPDTSTEVERVLIALDVTEEVVDYAIFQHFDLIISHHPLIFKPLTSVTEDNHVARKVIKLLENGVSVFSFHTRADKVTGGVNDRLCDRIGLFNTSPFGEDFLGRVGTLEEQYELEDFVYKIKQALGADSIRYADACNPVQRIAVVGGDGKSYVSAAIAEGADTYISGRIGYNVMEEAAEMGINLIEAGHFFTEQPVTDYFCEVVSELDPDAYVEILDSNVIKVI
ncbi:MAG: Nif3-like dinuclear metal center hexameric protein [Clostridia bacterium]|nr:Nif3-like dinuclear metal center hexameric protein [Clostridia bacterium]